MRLAIRSLLFVLGLSAVLAQDCNNPLFSEENWPEDEVDRPAYLSQPVDIDSVDLGLCSELLGDCSQTCCDEDTVSDIDKIVLLYLDYLALLGEGFVGPILDTIGDFDPFIQEAIGQEYSIDGDFVGDYVGDVEIEFEDYEFDEEDEDYDYDDGSDYDFDNYDDGSDYDFDNYDEGSDDYDENKLYNAEDDEDSEDDEEYEEEELDEEYEEDEDGPVFEEDISEDEREENIEAQQEEMGDDHYRPKHRGTRRYRPGLIALSDDQKAEISSLISEMVLYLGAYSGKMAKCLDSQAKQMAGMFCMGCNACYSDYVSSDSSSITVDLDQESCSDMADNCSNYLDAVQTLNEKFDDFKESIRAIIYDAIDAGDIEEEDVNFDDLDEIVSEDAEPVCSGDDCEEYFCNEVFEETGGLIPGEDIVDPYGLGVSDDVRRTASSYTVTLAYKEDGGFNPQKVDVTYNTKIDNYSAEDSELDVEDDDSAKYLVLGALALLALL
jgi:hypothetical protein